MLATAAGLLGFASPLASRERRRTCRNTASRAVCTAARLLVGLGCDDQNLGQILALVRTLGIHHMLHPLALLAGALPGLLATPVASAAIRNLTTINLSNFITGHFIKRARKIPFVEVQASRGILPRCGRRDSTDNPYTSDDPISYSPFATRHPGRPV